MRCIAFCDLYFSRDLLGNNNPNNVDSPGERSSQYAAESSCRLRFGPHVDWFGQFDIDEYFVPMVSLLMAFTPCYCSHIAHMSFPGQPRYCATAVG